MIRVFMESLKSVVVASLFSSLIAGISSHAEGLVKHHENTIVCFSDYKIADTLTSEQNPTFIIPNKYLANITSIESYDLNEALNGAFGESSKAVIKLQKSETSEKYMNRVLTRFQGWGRTQPGALQDTYKDEWYSQSEDIPNAVLEGKNSLSEIFHTKDSKVMPANSMDPITRASNKCVYTSIAKQDPASKKLVIDDRLFLHRLHSEISKTAVLLHEFALAKFGIIKGSSEPIRILVSNLISEKLTYQQLNSIIPRFNNFVYIPVAAGKLLWQARTIQAYLNSSYAYDKVFKARKEFLHDHLEEVPLKIRKRLYNEKFDRYGADLFSCRDLKNEPAVKSLIDEKTCEALKKLEAQREAIFTQIKDKMKTEYINAQTPTWTSEKKAALAALNSLKTLPEIKAKLKTTIESWNPFDLSKKIDESSIALPTSEVVFIE